jgi:RNA recognition motif-containing protein
MAAVHSRQHKGTAMNHKRIYVGDLSPTINETMLQELFGEVGEIESISIQNPKQHGLHRFAFIEFAAPESARNSVSRFNGYQLDGYRLIVYTVPPKSRPREKPRSS